MTSNQVLLLILIFVQNEFVRGANILGLMAVASPSHHIWNHALMNALAEKGHNVTVISADVETRNIPSSLHYILMENVYEVMANSTSELDFHAGPDVSAFEDSKTPWKFGDVECRGIVQSNGFKQLLNYPDNFKFDAIIYDYTCGPCLLIFLHKFKYPPLIGVSAFSAPHYTYELMGGHKQHAYVPHFSVPYSNDMTFFERIHNILVHAYEYCFKMWVAIEAQDFFVRPFCKDCPYLGDLEYFMRIVLVNTHFAVEITEPMPDSVIPVGGLHIKTPQPLDKKIQEFIETGEKGAILFSLGTNVKSDSLTPERKTAFIEAFKRFPGYNFLWKYESPQLTEEVLPKNVMITPWLNQNSILAHKHLKAFITHAGLLSTQEAVWWGVPMIGIPFFADQHKNIQKSVMSEIAVKLSLQDITVDNVEAALKEVLLNPKYKKNILVKSKLFQDQPQKPLDRATFWVEWIIRHKDGWKAIESPVKKIGVLRANGYDIILFVLVFTTVLIYFLFYLIFRKNQLIAFKSDVSKKKKN